MVEAVRSDPLYHNKASARLGWDILENGSWLESRGTGFPVPLLVMLGTEDKIVDAAAGAALARRLTGDVTLKTGEGMFHELHNEPERREIISYVLE